MAHKQFDNLDEQIDAIYASSMSYERKMVIKRYATAIGAAAFSGVAALAAEIELLNDNAIQAVAYVTTAAFGGGLSIASARQARSVSRNSQAAQLHELDYAYGPSWEVAQILPEEDIT